MRFLYFFFLTGFLIFSHKIEANTVLGGNITWTCLGNDEYKIRLTSYLDCYGYDLNGGIPTLETIFFLPTGCSSSAFSIDLSYVSNTQISDLCPTELASSSCSGGANQGVMQFTYEGTVTLVPGCQWSVVWSNMYWAYFINANEFTNPAYIHSIIDTSHPCYDSPTIQSTPSDPQVPYICEGTQEIHNLVLNGLPTGYTATYTLGENLVTNGDVFAAPTTSNGWAPLPGMTNSAGTITWTPTSANMTLNGVRVEIKIYDENGNHVGTINENMVFYVRDCDLTPTDFMSPQVTGTGNDTSLSGNNNIEVCAGDSLIFTVGAENSNPLRAITITETPIPGLPLVGVQSAPNPAYKTYTLLTDASHVGSYVLNVHAQDDACPTPDSDDTTINITVHPNVRLTFNDTTICYGESVTLNAIGLSPSAYTWTNGYGDPTFSPTPSSASQTVSPEETAQYIVTGTGIPAACQTSDAVVVRVLMTDLTYTKADETCGNSNGAINITVEGEPSSNISYSWTTTDGSGLNSSAEDQIGLTGGANYTVNVTETVHGCTLNETIFIDDIPVPTVTFTGDTTICAGGTATLTLNLTQGTAPYTVTGINSEFPINSPTDIHPLNVSPTSTTTYTITSLTDATGCSDNINQSVTVTVRPAVTATVTANGPLCLGDDLGLTVSFSAAGNYTLNYEITDPNSTSTALEVQNISSGLLAGTPNPTLAGVYNYNITSVQYTSAPLCASDAAANGSVNVSVNPVPEVTLTGTDTICAGTCHNLTLTLTGTGPWVVGYTLGGVSQTPLNVTSSPFTWNVCPSATQTYCITSVQDAYCTNSSVSGQCATITVVPYPVFNNYTLSETDICEGSNTTINVDFGPAGYNACLYFTASPADTDFALPFCSQPSGATFSALASPTVNTVYCLDSLTFEEFPQCATVVSVCRTVNVTGAIAVTETGIECNNIGTQYRVSYQLTGGDSPNYTAVSGSGTFDTIDPTIFVTSWVNSGSSGTWEFEDTFACNTVTMTANHSCPVLTEAGTMNTDSLTVCGTSVISATHNADEFLDGNDALMFILYSDESNPLISIIDQNCSSPEFSFISGMAYGTTYYISAVAGDEGSISGCVNTAAPNVQVSPGTPVTWYQIPEAVLSAPGSTSACEGNCVTLEIALTGAGPWTVEYSVDGTPVSPSLPQIPANTPGGIYSFCSSEDGTHELISVSDSHCAGTVDGAVDVTINPLPTAIFDGDGTTCIGINHCFEITLTGESPWNLTIDNPGAQNDTLTGISDSPDTSYCVGDAGLDDAGDYQIISVTDGNGCTNSTASAAVHLTVTQIPQPQWVSNDTTFCEGSDIQLEFAIIGGLAPFDIDFNAPGVSDLIDSPATGNVTASDAGTYEIINVSDANGCASTNTASITVSQIDSPIADAGPDVDICVNESIQIGTPEQQNHSYVWSPSTPGISPGPANIAQPTVTLSTANTTQEYVVHAYVAQCVSTDTMTVTVHGLPAIDITALSDSLCFNSCTNLEAISVDGTTQSYEWTASSSIQNTDLTDSEISVCPGGNETFEVTAYETHGSATCESQATIEIFVGTELQVAENFTDQVCNGTCEGEIHLVASGGFAPYSFDSSGDITDWNTIGLCPGTYEYTVIDAIGCEIQGSITIDERAPEVIDDITVTQPTCVYDLGEIQVNNQYSLYEIISGSGCSYSPATNPNTTGLFSNIPACDEPYTIVATFQVSATESCTTSTTVTIQPLSSEITFNEAWDNKTFCYEEQACFEASPSGGSGNLQVSWYTCAAADASCLESSVNPYCVPLTQDLSLYGVAVDANGCRSNIVLAEAVLSPEINLSVQNGLSTTEICEGDCLDLVAAASGGSNDISIDWFDASGTLIGAGSPLNLCPLVNTTYTAIASDGCSQNVSDTLLVIVHETPKVQIDADIYNGCYPQTINFLDLSDSLTDDYTCVWNFGNGASSTECGDVTYSYADFGQFQPFYTVTTEYGCTDTGYLPVTINIYGKPQMGFTWEPQPVTVINNEVQFINTTTAAVSYQWTVQGIGSSVQANPHFKLPPKDQEATEVCLIGTTIHGCKDTLCQEVFMETVLQVFVPNAFTPDFEDGNAVNDVFLPIVTGHEPDRYKIWIMNRWGDTVFYSEDSTEPWVGNFNKGSDYVQNDTYIWHIECYELGSNNLEVFQGTVTIIR